MFCSNNEEWLYKLPADYTWQSPYPQQQDWAFADEHGKVRLKLYRDGRMVVLKDYAWDGCTPKFCLFDILLGTPDGAVDTHSGRPKTWHASLVHDALCQFAPAGVPLSRAQSDRCFLLLMHERRFALRYIYYAAVRLFGWFTQPLTRKLRHIQGGQRLPLDSD